MFRRAVPPFGWTHLFASAWVGATFYQQRDAPGSRATVAALSAVDVTFNTLGLLCLHMGTMSLALGASCEKFIGDSAMVLESIDRKLGTGATVVVTHDTKDPTGVEVRMKKGTARQWIEAPSDVSWH